MMMVTKATDKRLTTKRQTTKDLKSTIGVSMPMELENQIRIRANQEDRTFSSMCVVLLKKGLASPIAS